MWFKADISDRIAIKGAWFNFMPSWWHRNYGFEYGERMVFDPDYRVGMHQAMRRVMAERFGNAKLGEADPRPVVVAPNWENAVTGALCGCEVHYPKDNYPLMRHLGEERIGSLAVPADLWTAFPYSEILRQVRHLNTRFGADAAPVIPTRGILNEAVLLRGDALFAEMLVEPAKASRILGFSFQLMKAQIAANFLHSACPVMIFNCTVPLVGPATYREKLQAYDAAIAGLCHTGGVTFSLHHCGNLDSYASAYRSLAPRYALLDIGHESNVRAALETFPEAEVSLIVSAQLMSTGSPADVGEKVDQVLEATRGHWHRLWLNVADIEYGAPDGNVQAVYERLKQAA